MSLDTAVSLAALVTAHLLADFPLQTAAVVRRKRRWSVMLLHAGLAASLSYLLMARWTDWVVPLVILVTHALFDSIKVRTPESTAGWSLLVDQAAHLAVVVALAFGVDASRAETFGLTAEAYLQALIFVSGAVLTIWTSGIIVGIVVAPYRRLLEASERSRATDGLAGAGRLIGQLERTLIFATYFAGAPGSIGFLIAAKSILRFGDITDSRNREAAEYIIIGTLLSFAFAAVLTLATAELLHLAGRAWPQQ